VCAYVSVLQVAKAGSSPDECEDAIAVVPESDLDQWLTEPLFIAIADGASESLLARDWANLLTSAVVQQAAHETSLLHNRHDFASTLINAGRQWTDWLVDYLAQREERGHPIAWYERPRVISKSVCAGSGRDDGQNPCSVSGDTLQGPGDLGDPGQA
jgi:hypothetical protein